jgi:hypothetical protein
LTRFYRRNDNRFHSQFRRVHRLKYPPIRENGIEPQLPTGPIIAHNGKKKNVANSQDVNTEKIEYIFQSLQSNLTYLLSLKIVPFVEMNSTMKVSWKIQQQTL